MSAWPYPGDAPTARARRVATAYRSRLADSDPDACAALDRIMEHWDQHWVIPRVAHLTPDQWISGREAAELAAVEPATIRQWRTRGRLVGRRDSNNRWIYRAGDVLTVTANTRRRDN